MTREERCKLAIEKGFKYNPETGDIIGMSGKILIGKINGYGVIRLIVNKKLYSLYSHHLAWYITHNEVVQHLDHINGDRFDNRIINLRSVTYQQNNWNRTTAKGYYWNKKANKWKPQIGLNGKVIGLGYYDTEDEAHQVYLQAKEKYHIMD